MATKKKGLGRGLNALLGGNESVEAMTMVQNEDELREIGIDLIRRGPWQPRTHFDEAALNELADSSVNFVVRPWTKTGDYWTVYWDITREVKMRFDREGISIPFPQRDVHFYEESRLAGGAESLPAKPSPTDQRA